MAHVVRGEITNELGNHITAEVKQSGEHEVTVTLTGPKSTSENIITTKEARLLQRLLNRYFRGGLF